MFGSPLRRALARGMKPGGNLTDELRQIGDYAIKSRKDALAICAALEKLPIEPPPLTGLSSPLRAFAGLFQDVDGREAPAFEVMYEQGLPLLLHIFDQRVRQFVDSDADDANDMLLVLKILAMYGSRAGAEAVVAAARMPLQPDAYLWHIILGAFSPGHPQQAYVYEALSNPLPPDFIAMALLDSANATANDAEAGLPSHPFDTPAGAQQLQHWLADRDPENFSYAVSATVALPFISNPSRDQLLAQAMDHIDPRVQLEAAWAAGKLGREAGFKMLARFCLDVNHAEVAHHYLKELDREDMIPSEIQDPTYQAKAQFASWLAHPNELGQPPDELQLVDHRQLAWPPEREPAPFWIFRFRLRDQTDLEPDREDCGLVGSMTWCFFSHQMNQRPPEDIYAIHCYWEMTHAGLIVEDEVTDPAEYAGMLRQWTGEPLEEPKIVGVAELSSQAQSPSHLAAVAKAQLDGNPGWVVLDGPRSTWYPQAEQPLETSARTILMLHVGGKLLGFDTPPDRQRYLLPPAAPREPQQIVTAYEKFLDEAISAQPARQADLLGGGSLLSHHFVAYVEALTKVHQTTRATTLVRVYERYLQIAAQADESIQDEVYESTSLLGDYFDVYVDALLESGRVADAVKLIQHFAPRWNCNFGHGLLGNAAFKAGEYKLAEPHLRSFRENHKWYYRTKEMSQLAEIWHDRGESKQAQTLLLDCLRTLQSKLQTDACNLERHRFAAEFDHHRQTYLRLWPGSEAELQKQGIPEKVE